MYAILDVNNRQYKVKQGQEIYVDLQQAEVGADLTFNKILLTENEGSVRVGTPSLNNASVSAKVLDHVKGDKVIIFKKKRRKGYRVKKGHRQQFTKIRIESITI
ncbi:MAG: 50S ribosomal protein L21 [Saprospiraceae bacterium]|jgi:large subunit ribosomal protein L21|nr:50S ribosomal protein L21 [Saprospiraceae bacterium]